MVIACFFIIAFLVVLGGIFVVGITGLITFVLSLFSIGAMAVAKRRVKFGNGWYAIPLIPLVISVIMVIPTITFLIITVLINML